MFNKESEDIVYVLKVCGTGIKYCGRIYTWNFP